jgi:general L-amino acid transport system permease protein
VKNPLLQDKAHNWFQDKRFHNGALQVLFFLILVYFISAGYANVIASLTKRGLLPSFHFLSLTAGFDIGEQLIHFGNSSSNARAILVGFLNTISISFLAIFFATILGLIIALCRLSSNWLLKKLALAYIEIIRNIPLLMLLLIWYRAFFLRLPGISKAIIAGHRISADGVRSATFIFSNRGMAIAWPRPTETFPTYKLFLYVFAVVAVILGIYLYLKGKKTGRKQMFIFLPICLFFGLSLLTILLFPTSPLKLDYPKIEKFNTVGGLSISAEWFSLFSGLVLYTSAFIAEAFRAGIQGVPRGQVEAARALGFSHMKTLRLVVIPQAKIVVIPPLTSIFLGVAKNTSLGVAIGFPDLFSIAGTIINQTGRSLEMILIVMVIYLTLSILTSLFMNWYNSRVQLKER